MGGILLASKALAVPKRQEEITYAPGDNEGAINKCIELYGLYVHQHKSVMQLALEFRETSECIRKKIKWAALQLTMQDEPDIIRQHMDSSLVAHLQKLEKILEDECSKVREKVAVMKEMRLTLKDIARVRGLSDFSDSEGKGLIQIILPPGLNRGQGVDKVVETQTSGTTQT